MVIGKGGVQLKALIAFPRSSHRARLERSSPSAFGAFPPSSKVEVVMTAKCRDRCLSVIIPTVAAGVIVASILIIPAVRKLNMARSYADETAALHSIQEINTAEIRYRSMFSRFAVSLTELGRRGGQIPTDLVAGEKQGATGLS